MTPEHHPAVVTTMTNGEVRQYRDSKRPKVAQREVARELGISRMSYIQFEYWQKPLPRRIGADAAIDAIDRVHAQHLAERNGAAK